MLQVSSCDVHACGGDRNDFVAGLQGNAASGGGKLSVAKPHSFLIGRPLTLDAGNHTRVSAALYKSCLCTPSRRTRGVA